jgi:hypothetical protein
LRFRWTLLILVYNVKKKKLSKLNQEQAGLSRATLEISSKFSSKFSSNFPLTTH